MASDEEFEPPPLNDFISDFVWQGRRIGDRRECSFRVFMARGHGEFVLEPPSASTSFSIADGSSALISNVFKSESFLVLDSGLAYDDPAVPKEARSLIAFRLGRASAPYGIFILSFQKQQMFSDEAVWSFHLLDALVDYFYNPWGSMANISELLNRWLSSSLRRVVDQLVMDHVGVADEAPGIYELSHWENGFSRPLEDEVLRWCYGLGILGRPRTSLVRVVNVSPELLRMLRETPERMRQLTPEQFEHLVADRISKMGFNVMLTGRTDRRDGGVDFIAVPHSAGTGTFLMAGQVKHHSADQKTGRQAVDRLIALKNSAFRVGLLATNTTFTKDAEWIAHQHDNQFFARLRGFADLKRWLQDDFQADLEHRELPEEIELTPDLKITIPRPRRST